MTESSEDDRMTFFEKVMRRLDAKPSKVGNGGSASQDESKSSGMAKVSLKDFQDRHGLPKPKETLFPALSTNHNHSAKEKDHE